MEEEINIAGVIEEEMILTDAPVAQEDDVQWTHRFKYASSSDIAPVIEGLASWFTDNNVPGGAQLTRPLFPDGFHHINVQVADKYAAKLFHEFCPTGARAQLVNLTPFNRRTRRKLMKVK